MNFKIPEDKGAKKRTRYWNVSVILGVFALILFFIGVNRAKGAELIACGWGSCCFSLVYAFSALSTKNDDRVIVIQQPAQYVPVTQQPIIQQTKQPQQKTSGVPAKTKTMWVQEAQNLELARNWDGAAEAYEKAGMYAEAGRIRKDHLENNQPVVNIGKVGDTILHDSVMISDESDNKIE
ncbi:MAG: hypothetical protein CMB55_01665 [Euryarchaeota archaeon]|nr:hypothetical protein [Euryarchaeota archaeon]|tara:strand:+ start:1378 stop:1917 length:540 start_codon:yes stop_codon:yes gene_type:complete